jgi:hypothetical protein
MDATIIALVMTIVKGIIKNPAKKAKLKKALLAVRDAIDAAYSDE